MLSALPRLVKLEDIENASSSIGGRRRLRGNENKDMILESMKHEDQ